MKAVLISFKKDRENAGGDLYIFVPEADGFYIRISAFWDGNVTIPSRGSYGRDNLANNSLVRATLAFKMPHSALVDVLTETAVVPVAFDARQLGIGADEIDFIQKHFSVSAASQ